MKRKYLLITFIPIVALALVAVVYLVISNLGQKPLQTPRIQRIFDIPEVKEQLKSGLFAPTYLEGFRLSNKTRRFLTPSGEFGNAKVIFYKLHEDYEPITWDTDFITPPALRSGEDIIRRADNLEQVLSEEGPAWCFSEPEVIYPETQILPGREITKAVDIPFKETRIELLVKLTKATSPVQKPRILIHLNDQLLAEVQLRQQEEIISVNTFKLSPEPGGHALKITYLNDKADKQQLQIYPILLSRILVGPLQNGILLKYSEETRRRIKLNRLFISYPALNHERKIMFDEMGKSNRLFGRAFKPEENPVIPVRLDDEGGRYETVRASAIVSNSMIKAKVILGSESVLEFSYGCYRTMVPSEPCNLNLRITDGGGSGELYSNSLSLSGIEAGRWHRARIPLNQVPAGISTLEFSLQAPPDKTFACLLGEPTVLTSAEPDEQTPPNVILISLDTLRADHLSCYGYHRQTSPTIDRIAQEGILFTNAYSQAGSTLPSHKAMLTGYYPLVLAYMSPFQDWDVRRLPSGVPTLATYLKEAGYYNVAFTNNGWISAKLGFYKDFDLYNELQTTESDKDSGDRIEKKIGFDRAYKWLQDHSRNTPFFLFLHTYCIHSSYAAPPEYDQLFRSDKQSSLPVTISSKYLGSLKIKLRDTGYELPDADLDAIVSAYDRGIRWTDDEIKKLYDLLDSLDLLENTVLIITSDHGEEFLEHNSVLHTTMYNELLHVPLIIKYTGRVQAGSVIDSPVESIDIVATILDLLGKKPSFPIHGRSLLPLLEGRSDKLVERPRFGSFPYWHVVFNKKHKLIMSKRSINVAFELFDLEKDPLEQTNLFDTQTVDQEVKELMIRQLLFYIGQNHPGLNIFLYPEDPTQPLYLKITGINLRESNSYNKVHLYDKKSNYFQVNINKPELTVNTFPALVSMKGEPADKPIKIEFNGRPASAGSNASLERMKVGLSGNLELPSPLVLFSNSSIYKSIPFHDGMKESLQSKSGAIVWYTSFGWEWLADEAVEAQPDDLEEQLKQLGYVQ